MTLPGKYFVRRNSSSLIVFTLGENELESGFRLAGAHTDSPSLKIKPSPDKVKNSYMQLGVEVYGGGLLTTWFDRDLSIAGRIVWKDKTGHVHSSLIDFKRPVGVIPSLAIHLDKEANDKKTVNKQNDLVPVIMLVEDEDEIYFANILKEQLIREHQAIESPQIIDHELFFYNAQSPSLIGIQNDFISGARLDNLVSCYTLVSSIIKSNGKQNCLIVLNDHEETGSMSTSGAQGNFLQSILERLLPESESRQRCLSRSLFISADNAHAVHPNFADRFDQEHLPQLNKGPVIKYNANQRYASNSQTASFFKLLCEKSKVPVQSFVMRSDMPCGSTIGPLTAGRIGVRTVDVGIASHAMHSIRELVGSHDTQYFYTVFNTFFNSAPNDTIWQCLSEITCNL